MENKPLNDLLVAVPDHKILYQYQNLLEAQRHFEDHGSTGSTIEYRDSVPGNGGSG